MHIFIYLKPILTIFFALCFLQGFTQDDSLLQRMIDSVKTQQPKAPAVLKKDSAKAVIKTAPLKKDSAKTTYIADSLLHQDSTTTTSADTLMRDSLAAATIVTPVKPLTWSEDTAFQNLLKLPYIKKDIQPLLRNGDPHLPQNKDYLFYLLVGIVLLVAIIKQLFPKYFSNLFRLLFEASFRQKQKREQLMQETLPSLMMNILFIIVGGLFIAILANTYNWLHTSFWWLIIYSITVLALVYIFKYIVIQFTGWVFNAKEPASTYSFIVFLINKIIGVALLPLLLLLAFSSGSIWDITMTIATSVIILLFLFRYILSLTIIRSTLNINPLHFFIYLCAVELMPMLIIYKVLFNYIGNSNY